MIQLYGKGLIDRIRCRLVRQRFVNGERKRGAQTFASAGKSILYRFEKPGRRFGIFDVFHSIFYDARKFVRIKSHINVFYTANLANFIVQSKRRAPS